MNSWKQIPEVKKSWAYWKQYDMLEKEIIKINFGLNVVIHNRNMRR